MIENEGAAAPDSTTDDTTAPDPIRQLKGEMTRKTDKIASQLEIMQKNQEQLTALLQQATAPRQPAPAKKQDDLDSLMYSDNAKYRAILKEQAAEEVITRINTQNQANQATQNTIAELSREYPELADAENELTKKAVSILKSLPAHEQTMTTAYKFAVKEAAEQLSMKPRSKRDPDEFVGATYSPNAPQRRREVSDKQILNDTTPLAEAMGLDMSNPDTQKRIVARSKRDWARPTAPIRTRKGK